MSITIVCPKCNKRHSAPDSLAGRAARCKCGNVIQIPAPVGARPATGSLFDELSTADTDRLKNAPPARAGPSAHANPYQSPVLARHIEPTQSRQSAWRLPSIKWPISATALCIVLLLAAGYFGISSINSNPKLSRAERSARIALHGKTSGTLAGLAIGVIWFPWVGSFAYTLFSRR